MRKFLNSFKVVILAMVIAVGVSYLYADWQPPTAAPTVSNVYAPINTGPVDQVKRGGIGAESFAATGDITSLTGSVKAQQICIADDCRNEWPSSGDGGDSGDTGEGLANKKVLTGAVSAAGGTTCVITDEGASSGAIYCTGYNVWGQVGVGNTNNKSTFTALTAFSGGTAKKIVGSGSHFCALDTSDAIWCWGNNRYGQVGNGTKVNSRIPVKINAQGNHFTSLDTNVVYYDDGSIKSPAFTCAVSVAGEVWCWGHNGRGQLGRGFRGEVPPRSMPTAVRSTTPAKVQDIGGASPRAVKVVTGGLQFGYACALIDQNNDSIGDSVKCWGSNAYGQLGDGTIGSTDLDSDGIAYSDRTTPVSVIGLPGGRNITDIAVVKEGNDGATCVISEVGAGTREGEIYCWGHNGYGQTGASMVTHPVLNPVRVAAAGGVQIQNAKYLRSGGQSVDNGQNFCAGLGDGTAVCWGVDDRGQSGDGTRGGGQPNLAEKVKINTATTVMTNIIDLQLSHSHAVEYPHFGCAIVKNNSDATRTSGDVYCWGGNDLSQLALSPGTGSHPIPKKVTLPGSTAGTFRVNKLIVGAYHVCAILDGVDSGTGTMVQDPDEPGELLDHGRMFCWGHNRYGALGNGQFNTNPQPTPQIPQ